MSKLTKIGYSLDDMSIIQSEIAFTEHRKDVNPYIEVCGREMYPIFASPMESVVDENNYKTFIENKITPVIPRTVQERLSIEERIKLSQETFVSFSLEEIKTILEKDLLYTPLIDVVNYHIKYHICIDIAHGTLNSVYELAKKLRTAYNSYIEIMAGNVANPLAYSRYCDAGINYMRLSVGSGSRCTTACATGIFYPSATLLDDIVSEKEKYIHNHPEKEFYTKIIMDGGVDWYDKVTKSIALGADAVMIGKLFAETEEACGEIGWAKDELSFANGSYYNRDEFERYKKYTEEELNLFGYKKEFLQPFRMYRGMSHRYSQKLMGGDGSKVSEGICKPVKVKYTLSHWINNMDAYLRSCMTYTNSKTIDELKDAHVIILGNNGKMAYAK